MLNTPVVLMIRSAKSGTSRLPSTVKVPSTVVIQAIAIEPVKVTDSPAPISSLAVGVALEISRPLSGPSIAMAATGPESPQVKGL